MKTPPNQPASESAPSKANSIQPAQSSALGRILSALLAGEPLTAGEAWRRFGHSRLAAAVYELRKRYGYRIESQTIEVDCADGRRAHIASYRIGGGQ